MHAKPGAVLRAGDPLMTLHTDTPERFDRAIEALDGAYFIAPEDSRPDQGAPPACGGMPLVIDRIS
jgi:thymidine phosphorylase